MITFKMNLTSLIILFYIHV